MLKPDSLLEEIIQQVSGEKAWWLVNHLAQYHRIESSSGYHKAALYVEEKVKEYGLKDMKIETFDKTLVVESLRDDLPGPDYGFFRTGIILKSLDSPLQNTIFTDSPKCFLYHDALLISSKQTWEYDFELNKNEILPGKYLVFPYLLIPQRNVPPELIESISPSVEDFGMDYLKLPMKRIDGFFKVLDNN